MSQAVFIVAEVGVNHNGSTQTALALVDAAAEARADAVKFQTFRADLLATASAPKAEYQRRAVPGAESQREMLRRLELSREAHFAIVRRCRDHGIAFLSTPFDEESLAFLSDELTVPLLKIGSGDLTNGPLLRAAARTGKPLILSTGMATLAEIEQALTLVGRACCDADTAALGRPAASWGMDETAWRLVRERVTLLQCTTAYPAAPADMNLRAMETLRQRFGTRVGLSDHSAGLTAAVAAAALGASVIEKHLTLDRAMPGPDHAASLEPAGLKEMVAAIREVGLLLGSGEKQPTPTEQANAAAARKSLVALRAVRRGERFTVQNLSAMRPGTGISPMRYWEWLGRTASRDYAAGEVLEP